MTKLAPGSVGTKELCDGAMIPKKVRAGSLLTRDFKHGQLPRGLAGPTGTRGPSFGDGMRK